MSTSLRRTTADLEVLPDNGNRYEIIDGELYVTTRSDWDHQMVSGQMFALLQEWSLRTGAGESNLAPGVIFADDDAVAPDVVWVSAERLATSLDAKGRLHAAPELAVEVLSPGDANQRRDREAKLKLYSRRGVDEYWIVDWRARTIMVFRRVGAALEVAETFTDNALLTTPLLPGFSAPLARVFAGIPSTRTEQPRGCC